MPANPDPFQQAREIRPVEECEFQGERVPMLLRHRDIREATRDWKTFSSDAPFRVPIPSEESVRKVRQLPIETDPPNHTDYRRLIEPFFNRPREPWMQDKIRALIAGMLGSALAAESIEVVKEFALPVQSRALAILLGVPLAAADEWICWGMNVFKDSDAEGLNEEKGAGLDRYIQRRLDEAEGAPGDDFFSALTTVEFRGRRLTREEMTGFCNLTFAGGRDTVIHSISSIVAHIAECPETLRMLRDNPKLVMSATEEFMRHISPMCRARTSSRVGGYRFAGHLPTATPRFLTRLTSCGSTASRTRTWLSEAARTPALVRCIPACSSGFCSKNSQPTSDRSGSSRAAVTSSRLPILTVRSALTGWLFALIHGSERTGSNPQFPGRQAC